MTAYLPTASLLTTAQPSGQGWRATGGWVRRAWPVWALWLTHCLCAVLLVMCSVGSAYAADGLVVGVVGSRTPEVFQTRYGPLAEHLSEQIGVPVKLRILDQPGLEQAVQQNQLDLVLTNPSHFLKLRSANAMTSVLATMVSGEHSVEINALGGVIIARAARADLGSLGDLARATIAAPGKTFLGGYQAQAFELKEAGIELSDKQMRWVGTHDKVVQAVLAGDVDVGFVRSGEIEHMLQQRTLLVSDIRVINPQRLGDFPYLVSTRLYPEWPVLALPHLEPRLARKVASALLALDANHPAMQAARLHAFTVPADYLPIETLARSLRLPPFDAVPEFTLNDVVRRHSAPLALIGVLLLLLSGAGVALVRNRLQLKHALAVTRQAEHTMRAEQQLLKGTLAALPDLMMVTDAEGVILAVHTAQPDDLLAPPAALLGNKVTAFLPPDIAAIDAQAKADATLHGVSAEYTYALQLPSGTEHFAIKTSALDGGAGQPARFVSVIRNITERKRAEDGLTLAASVFTYAQEGIMITDAQGLIIDVNQSFTRITGYAHAEVLGRKPSMLSSGRQGQAFYEGMWHSLRNTGQWHGEIWNRRRSGEVYAEVLTITAVTDAQGNLRHHVGVFSDITAQKEHQKQLEFIAHYDVLTGLPNRSLLNDRLQQGLAQAQRRGSMLAVVFLDFDGFKLINDTHGHEAGDHLLQTIGKRMADCLRDGDTLARMGGDEFVAVLNELAGTGDCERVLNRLLAAASGPLALDDVQLRISASLGVALFPQDASDADMLLRHADQAMYQAKQGGKDRYHFFDAGEDDAARHRREHVDQVAKALADNQFELYFQPKVNMRHGLVVGAEALIRWHHPDGTVHAPGTFLPAIEGHPVSAALDRWVMSQALSQLTQWHANGLALPLSVNVSAYLLQQKDFVAQLKGLLDEHPTLDPHTLELEVLETSALEDMEWVADVMHACSTLGVGFALDDFGTGYSSLTYLKRLPAQVLKIDQSFVRDMLIDAEDLTIVEGVISLAQAFGRTVIAEGVETTDHGDMLLRLGCDLAQGYGVARPMPAQAFETWAMQWQAPATWQSLAHRVPSRRDLPLVLAEVHHRNWLLALHTWLSGTPDAPVLTGDSARFERLVRTLDMTGVLPHPGDAQTLRSLYTAVQQAGQTLADCTRAQDAAGANQAHHTLNACSAAFMDKLHSLGH